MDDIEIDKLKLKQLKTNHFKYDLPNGTIIFFYNEETDSFNYYTDDSDISFKTLDAIARLYCIKNNCKNLCINSRKEQENADFEEKKKQSEFKDKNEEECIKKEEEKCEKKKNVFVKFNEYSIKKNKKYEIKTNRFTKRGRLCDWIEPNQKENIIKEVNFEQFKNEHGQNTK